MKRIFSFPAMLSAGLVLLTFLTVRSRFNDPDTWWHLKVGERIVLTGALPHTDEYSFTTNRHPWTPHEWLSQIFLYSAYKVGGYHGVWLWLWGLASLVFILLYTLCCWYSGNPKVAFLGGLIGWFFGTVSLTARPLLVGHLFLVLELILLYLGANKDRRWLWALPPLFAVWVNCHGSYLLGVVVLGIHAVCSFAHIEAGRLISKRAGQKERVEWCAVSALSVAALLLNPVGWKLLAYPLDVFTRQSSGLAFVEEWRALDVTDVRGVGLFAVAGLLGLIFLVRSKPVPLHELILVLVGFGMALRHARMLFAFGILAAPAVCRLLADTLEPYKPDRDKPIANASLMALTLLIIVIGFPRLDQLEEQVRAANPVAALNFIRSAGLDGRMINDYRWGGYLIWAAPERPVFIDGRADVYDWTGVFKEFSRWARLEEDPNQLLDKWGIQYCLLRKRTPIAVVMLKMPGWQKVYEDDLAVVLSRAQRLPANTAYWPPSGTALSRSSTGASRP